MLGLLVYINVSTQFITSYGHVYGGNRYIYNNIGLNIETVWEEAGNVWGSGRRLCMRLTGNACKGGLKNAGVRGEKDKVMMGGSLRWEAGL